MNSLCCFINYIRSIIFYMGYSVSLFVVGLISLPLLLLPIKVAAPVVLLWNRFVLLWLRICCGIHYEINGDLNSIPRPCVVVVNHQSPWETIFLQLHFYPLTTVLKRELLRIPFFGWGMRILRPIAIDRSSPMQALKQIKKVGVERLCEGQSILIFPEGTRQPVNKLGSFARSGADIAKSAGVPIVMVWHNAGEYWTNKKILKKPGKVIVHIGSAINVDDKNTKEIMLDIQHWMANKVS
ncbi:MAG: 1-acyl-sn-glycerol-3-phosphate acyltransferase [Granulosicoccus sp.]|jgi:1-acyl-sn-glycerol-3-phosphate acyltransferase